jgi:hypothetical protein
MQAVGKGKINPEDEVAARAALTAYVFSQEKAAFLASTPHLANLATALDAVESSPGVPYCTTSFGEIAAVHSGLGEADLPLDRLATTVLFSNAAAGTDEAALKQQREHKSNQVLQRTFTGQ